MVYLIAVLLLGAAAYLGAVWFFFSLAMARWFRIPPEKIVLPGVMEHVRANTAQLNEYPWELVTITSRDGLRLVGHWYPQPDARRTVVLCHGWRSGWDVDFSAIALWLRGEGCNVLCTEQRAQGASEGRYMGFGVPESRDCCDWARWCAERVPGLPVYLYGMSMGGAAVLMAADRPLPGEVRGIIADSAFTAPLAIMNDVGRRAFHLPPRLLMGGLDRLSRALAGVNLKETSAPEALRHSQLPVLLIHGTGDSFVPYRMAEENFAACAGEKQLLTCPGAGHCAGFALNRKAYKTAVRELFRRAESI